ncbi:uncharacterized protein LOC128997302 [Macrosteles quadrilineatus]|uniref:uncharacterized protein LOC128997302 n=1 Tax=Macrosteles quadrilineatus TaxID=74068 RepID=UPI0023E0BE4C|nr:uncharacterized protein LOC128997302 [Macrosteles quadrilineatus]
MIRLVLVSSFILILGFYEAKGAPNGLPLRNDETRTRYRPIEEKGVEVASYGRVVEGKLEPETKVALGVLGGLVVTSPVWASAGAIAGPPFVIYKAAQGLSWLLTGNSS